MAIFASLVQRQPPTIRTSVNLVLLDVAVYTKDGKPAAGLKRENFRIVDAGAGEANHALREREMLICRWLSSSISAEARGPRKVAVI